MFATISLTLALVHSPGTYQVQIIHSPNPQGDSQVYATHITNTNVSGSFSPNADGHYVPMIYTGKGGLVPIALPSGATFGYGHGSNNRDQVVGEYSDGVTNYAFVWSAKTGTITLPSNGARAYAWGINNAGEIVGSADVAPGQGRRAVIFVGAEPTALDPLDGYASSGAIDVNNGGTVFGVSDGQTGTGYVRATYWTRGGQAVDMGVLSGFNNSNVNAGNDKGEAVGYCFGGLTDSATPYLYSHGHMTAITLPATPAIAYDINDKSDIVGTYVDPEVGNLGFAIINGKFHLLNDLVGPDYYIEQALAVNNSGQIVATGFDMATFDTHTFLITP